MDERAVPRRLVRIVQLDLDTLQALADGDLDRANASAPVPLTPAFVADDWRATWRLRSRQVAADPAAAAWVTGVVWDVDSGRAVGRAGFHGPPDTDGMVEVGYSTDPAVRRRGYARAALVALLERADREPAVRTVRASIRPDNVASLALVEQYDFVAVGRQWDDEDGWERVYEVQAGRGRVGRDGASGCHPFAS